MAKSYTTLRDTIPPVVCIAEEWCDQTVQPVTELLAALLDQFKLIVCRLSKRSLGVKRSDAGISSVCRQDGYVDFQPYISDVGGIIGCPPDDAAVNFPIC